MNFYGNYEREVNHGVEMHTFVPTLTLPPRKELATVEAAQGH